MAGRARQNLLLEIQTPDGETRRQPLVGQRVLIGRSSEADVCLSTGAASRKHAELSPDPSGRWWVRDLQSRNGTWVNGKRVNQQLLLPGDALKIAEHRIRVIDPDVGQASSALTASGQVAVEDQYTGSLNALSDVPPPVVKAEHLSRLIQFGRELGELDDPAGRAELLCQLMTGGSFPGRVAMML